MTTKAQMAASRKYLQNNYSGISVKLPKATVEQFKQLAAANGDSVRQIIKIAVETYISEHGGTP